MNSVNRRKFLFECSVGGGVDMGGLHVRFNGLPLKPGKQRSQFEPVVLYVHLKQKPLKEENFLK